MWEISAGNEFLVPIFLATIFVAALFSSRTRVPYTMMLVAIGIALSLLFKLPDFAQIVEQLRLDPKLILGFVIPPLIFEAMMKVDYDSFKKIRISALLLATVGVILATVVGGFMLMYAAGLPFNIAFAFAALIAPTDAAIVIEIFKRVRVPHLLSTLMESEASFNDATGVIMFSSILALTIGSSASVISSPFFAQPEDLSIIGEAEYFALVFFGGIGIGLGISEGARRLHSLVDDAFSEVALTVATVFGAVAFADVLGISGLVAVAVVGLYFGNVTLRKESVVSQKTRDASFTFWEMAAFFANSVAFLYLGVTMDVLAIGEHIVLIMLAFGVVLATRAAVTFSILSLTDKFTKERIPVKWRNVVFLGGMKGAISVALVASLPESEFKLTLESITFGVVLSSLILQYVALSGYIRRSFHALQDGAL